MRKEGHSIVEAYDNMLEQKYKTKGSSVKPGTGARIHQSTHAKDRLIEHTMRTEFNDYVGSSVNPREAKGVIGDSNHKLNFKFPEGKNPRKEVPAQPRKAYPKGEHKGGH